MFIWLVTAVVIGIAAFVALAFDHDELARRYAHVGKILLAGLLAVSVVIVFVTVFAPRPV